MPAKIAHNAPREPRAKPVVMSVTIRVEIAYPSVTIAKEAKVKIAIERFFTCFFWGCKLSLIKEDLL